LIAVLVAFLTALLTASLMEAKSIMVVLALLPGSLLLPIT
jgi:hypothetical protein